MSACAARIIAFCLLAFFPCALAQEGPRGLSTVRAGAAFETKGNRWAVVIGVSAYRNLRPEEQLRFAHRDAEDFAAFLRSPNGGGFPTANIKVLLNQQATLAAIRTALGTWLPRSVEPDDVVYIFFAGHGVVESEHDGYLLAHDSDAQNLYATALSVAELDTIIRERVKARNLVLIADACHAGRLGWQSRGERETILINTYLSEVGKSGSGVLRILASRPDQQSFEDQKWGGGHGAFTFFLLQGLAGKADKDKDQFVRAAELLDYLSEAVPAETQALQHPRFGGNIDPRLPLSIIEPPKNAPAGTQPASPSKPTTPAVTGTDVVLLEIRGEPGSEVYVDKIFRGRVRPDGTLLVDKLSRGRHELSIDTAGRATIVRSIALSEPRTVHVVTPVASSPGPVGGRADAVASAAGPAAPRPGTASGRPDSVPARPDPSAASPLVAQIRESLQRGIILEQGGAWWTYKRLLTDQPGSPARFSLEVDLATALEEIGQQAINIYVNAGSQKIYPNMFHRAALAFKCLKELTPASSPQFESKRLFCEGRALIVEGKHREAIPLLERAIAIDGKSAYAYNALGIAYENQKDDDKAMDSFKRAAELAPNWELPRVHLGILYYSRGKMDKAEEQFRRAILLEPRDGFARLMLARTLRQSGRLEDAERVALDVTRNNPAYADGFGELGLIYEASKRYADAAAAFETFLRLDPNSKDAPAVRERVETNRRMGGKKSLKKN
jgi:tetratricopeptide (TPR) repeat protein